MSYDGLVAHELAHQWWGDLVTCHGWHHNWLNESWATFCENLYAERAHGDEAAAWDRIEKFSAYVAQDLGQYRRPIVFDRYTIPMDLFDRHSYEKGSLVLGMLRDELGDEPFFRGARLYLARHAEGFADTHEFRRAMEDASGRDLNWFFDQWVFAGRLSRDRRLVALGRARGGDRARRSRRSRTREPAGPETHARVPLPRRGRGRRNARRDPAPHRGDRARADVPARRARPAAARGDRPVVPPAQAARARAARGVLAARAREGAADARAHARRAHARGGAACPRTCARSPRRWPATTSPQVRAACAVALRRGWRARTLARATREREPRAGARARAASGSGTARAPRGGVRARALTAGTREAALLEALDSRALVPRQGGALRRSRTPAASRLLAACDGGDGRTAAGATSCPWRRSTRSPSRSRRPAFDLAYASLRYGETQEVREAARAAARRAGAATRRRRARPEQARHVGADGGRAARGPVGVPAARRRGERRGQAQGQGARRAAAPGRARGGVGPSRAHGDQGARGDSAQDARGSAACA